MPRLLPSGRTISERIVVMIGIALICWISVFMILFSDRQTSFDGAPEAFAVSR